jgi:hypothetical protein
MNEYCSAAETDKLNALEDEVRPQRSRQEKLMR